MQATWEGPETGCPHTTSPKVSTYRHPLGPHPISKGTLLGGGLGPPRSSLDPTRGQIWLLDSAWQRSCGGIREPTPHAKLEAILGVSLGWGQSKGIPLSQGPTMCQALF